MAFKLKKSQREPMSEINVTPFVDVMLVLLIINLITTQLDILKNLKTFQKDF